ncbi:MAG: triose-phosphate isomerase [Candidatus Fermentibacteraceae bacterium]|nr:triose-phosphate isomerase [Candidatus Fermentibacteraceae bacterium]MBN2607970.1 triose-phosphate isomerase [Candidatus Fermentibacteraceae bacterium]
MNFIIGANWKMYGTVPKASDFLEELLALGSRSVRSDLVLFAPFTLLPLIGETAAAAGIELGGQDLFWEDEGAFTGEVSPGMLREAGATWFLAGHSERRHVIGESDGTVRKKLSKGLQRGLKGILCVGELLEEREAGRTEEVVKGQIRSALEGLETASAENLVIAYEPVWAIGTGLTATPGEAQRMHSLIREWVEGIRGVAFASGLRIQYGGSVKPDNAGDILSRPSVNGALVGGASLRSDSFWAIVRSVPDGE